MNRDETSNLALIPINQDFIDVFETFMDDNQKVKIRANNVRQYVEGIIDLLLKDKIVAVLKPNENYDGVNWKRKIKIITQQVLPSRYLVYRQMLHKPHHKNHYFSGQQLLYQP